jgi:8-oxo-dGTP pyrophosphatase MutT (NUDIX family)
MSQRIPVSQNQRLVAISGFDPQTQPIMPAKTLPPLAPATLESDFIRSAFNRPIQWQVEPVFTNSFNEERFSEECTEYKDIIQAAVFIGLVQRPAGLNVIFTRRASHLHNHAGQISFPGGRIEPVDRDATAAALRETQEEIGITADFIQVIGTHPCFLTSTRFTMKPVVGLVQPGFTITADLTEVAEVFEVPLSVLMDTRLHRLHEAQLPDGGHRFYFSLSWNSYFIWGATAALVRNLYHFLAAAQGMLDS